MEDQNEFAGAISDISPHWLVLIGGVQVRELSLRSGE
jgi:hypothetical protein